MGNIFTRAADRFLGRGEASITVPPMDGALKPNNVVDEAERLAIVERPDSLLRAGGRILFSSAQRVMAADDSWDNLETVLECEGDVLAIAAAPEGTIAVFDSDRGLRLLDPARKSATGLNVPRLPIRSVTAAAFLDADRLLICVGSTRNTVTDWQRDLLESEAAGAIWSLNLRSGNAKPVLEGLGYPAGCLVQDNGRSVLISESWKSRLVTLDLERGRCTEPVLTALPGYPCRLSPRAGGGAWLAFFAPLNQLVEFVRREPVYRRAMMAEVPKAFWIAPALSSGVSFSEPMQGGALKQMGILKPWAPTRSYGLVIALDANFTPVASFHSRAGGRRHGLVSVIEDGTSLVVASKGADEIISLAL